MRRANLDGSNQETILENLAFVRGITIHGDYLYFLARASVFRVEKDTGADMSLLAKKVDGNTLFHINVFNGERRTCKYCKHDQPHDPSVCF